jgi:hypothetical protein
VDIPVYFVDGLNHGTILSQPSDDLVDLVIRALQVSSKQDLDDWHALATQRTAAARDALQAQDQWQQFVVHAVDERDDGIPDYNIQFVDGDGNAIDAFDTDVHTYSSDPSYRCFHVNLSQTPALDQLSVRIIASSGTPHVLYFGSTQAFEATVAEEPAGNVGGEWDAVLNLSHLLPAAGGGTTPTLFYPFTTTLVELRLNREPSPRGDVANDLFRFLPPPS